VLQSTTLFLYLHDSPTDARLVSIVVAGANGEAVASSRQRMFNSRKKRSVLPHKLGRSKTPDMLAVVLDARARGLMRRWKQGMAVAGATLVLVPSYFHFAMVSNAIINFF
jgi:4-hydroxy-2-oxoglutarate aldolase